MTILASQITSLTVVYSIVYSGVNQRKHQSSASLAFVREIHWGPVNFPHKWPVTRKMFPFDDVIMILHKSKTMWLGENMHNQATYIYMYISIGLDNGLLPIRHQAIMKTIADLSSHRSHGIIWNRNFPKIQLFSSKKLPCNYPLQSCHSLFSKRWVAHCSLQATGALSCKAVLCLITWWLPYFPMKQETLMKCKQKMQQYHHVAIISVSSEISDPAKSQYHMIGSLENT